MESISLARLTMWARGKSLKGVAAFRSKLSLLRRHMPSSGASPPLSPARHRIASPPPYEHSETTCDSSPARLLPTGSPSMSRSPFSCGHTKHLSVSSVSPFRNKVHSTAQRRAATLFELQSAQPLAPKRSSLNFWTRAKRRGTLC